MQLPCYGGMDELAECKKEWQSPREMKACQPGIIERLGLVNNHGISVSDNTAGLGIQQTAEQSRGSQIDVIVPTARLREYYVQASHSSLEVC